MIASDVHISSCVAGRPGCYRCLSRRRDFFRVRVYAAGRSGHHPWLSREVCSTKCDAMQCAVRFLIWELIGEA